MPAPAAIALNLAHRAASAAALPLALFLVAAALSACGSSRGGAGYSGSGAYPGAAAVHPTDDAPRHATLSEAPTEERVHHVAKGDTLYSISKRYGVEVAQLKAANGVGPDNAISLGQALRVPGGGRGASFAQAAPRRSFAPDPNKAQAAAAALGPQRIERPVPGEILRGWGEGVGRRKNAGVDLAAKAGDPVGAAADGKVAFVSDPSSPVGAVVLIEHKGGMTTIYGRLARIAVKPGQKVRSGQTIAHVAPRHGDRAALHFEIRYGSEPVNPTPFL